MKQTLRILSALLGYPSVELRAHILDLREALRADGALPRPALRRLDPLLDRLGRDDVLDAQATYSELFDRSRALSLHLFEHVHGDSRDRGPAMIDLAGQYLERGLLLDANELPDFVPVFVEYASCLPDRAAKETLAEPAHVFAALETRLRDRASDYAAIFAALVILGGGRPDAEALAELREKEPTDDPALIDEEWEEKEVTFTGPQEMGGPTGIVARLRARGKAMSATRSKD